METTNHTRMTDSLESIAESLEVIANFFSGAGTFAAIVLTIICILILLHWL